MNQRPRSFLLFLVVGVALWLVVTAAAVVEVIRSPADHLPLALGVVLIWVVLIIFAAFSKVTEYVGRGPR